MLKKMKRRVRPVSLSLVAAAVTAAAFAALSFADKDDGGSPQGVGPRVELSEQDREAMEEFRSCMSEQGVDVPEPPPAPGSEGDDGDRGDRSEHRLKPPTEEERAEMEKAFEACEDKLPEGAPHPGPPCGPPPGGPAPGQPAPGAPGQQQDQSAPGGPVPQASS